MSEVADTDERNRVCFLAWGKKTEAEEIACEVFPTEKYEHVKDVAIFAEHETTDRKGNVQKYDRDALKAIVDKCNSRILDTKSFAKISDGHTPDPSELSKGAKCPDVLGYAGNFHLGMVGNLKPRWAIFADEYRYKDTAQQTAKKPGRSVEVWLHENIADRFFDPIAALGAETPRLDLPMKFTKSPSGVEVAKYAAMAGPTNTYLPEPLKAPKERYESMLSPEEVTELCKQMAPVLGQMLITPLVQALVQAQQTAAPPAPPVPPVTPPVTPPATPSVAQNAGDEMGGMMDKDDDNVPGDMGEEDDEDQDEYSAEEFDEDEEGTQKMSKTSSSVEVAKYRRQLSDLEARNKALESQVAGIKRDKVLLERYSKLSSLQAEGYKFVDRKDASGKVISGLDHEMNRVAKMSDQQFNDHVTVIVENYQKLDVPIGRFPGVSALTPEEEAHDEQVSKASQEAASRVEKYRREGKKATFKDEFESICRERGITI